MSNRNHALSDQFARIAELDNLMTTEDVHKIASAVSGSNIAKLESISRNPLLTSGQCLTLFGKLNSAYDRIRLLEHKSFPASALADLARTETEPSVLEAIALHPQASDEARFIAHYNGLINSQVSIRWAG